MVHILVLLGALALLMFLAFRGITLLILAPAIALLAAVLSGGLPVLGTYTQIFMVNAGPFIVTFFPLFLLGAIFGKLMDDSGAARSIARAVNGWLGPKRAIASVVLCCAVLTYGGVSAFVVAFAMVPVAAAVFRQADIPKRLIPGALSLGGFSFTMSALPGTPAIQNAIPMPFFNTTAFAAPGLGILAAIVMAALGMAWLQWRAGRARLAGEGYGVHDDSVPAPDVTLRERAMGAGFDARELTDGPPAAAPGERLPPFAIAILPVILVIVVNFAYLSVIVPRLDTSFLADPLFGETTIENVRGVWAVIVGLFLAILLLIATNFPRLTDLKASLDKGADASVLPIFNVASLVGFGAVIAVLPGFQMVVDALLAATGGNALVSVAASVGTLSAMTGSASGGMSIALEILGETFVALAQATGTSLEAMHRVTSIAASAFDALPHNGAVITLLTVCKLSHREAYLDIFAISIVVPLVALISTIIVASLVGSF